MYKTANRLFPAFSKTLRACSGLSCLESTAASQQGLVRGLLGGRAALGSGAPTYMGESPCPVTSALLGTVTLSLLEPAEGAICTHGRCWA